HFLPFRSAIKMALLLIGTAQYKVTLFLGLMPQMKRESNRAKRYWCLPRLWKILGRSMYKIPLKMAVPMPACLVNCSKKPAKSQVPTISIWLK
ncbi:MAG: hypothetical protein ACN6NT_09450, partial [Comamonas sp.]